VAGSVTIIATINLLVNSMLLLDGVISGGGGVFKTAWQSVMTASNSYTGRPSSASRARPHEFGRFSRPMVDVQARAMLDGSGLDGSFTIQTPNPQGSGIVLVRSHQRHAGSRLGYGGRLANFSNRLVLAGKTVIQISGSSSPQARVDPHCGRSGLRRKSNRQQ